MIESKTFTFQTVKDYSAIFTSNKPNVIEAWMDAVCKETAFVEFELKAMYCNDDGNVILTYFAMKSDKVNPFYEFRHLALQEINLN